MISFKRLIIESRIAKTPKEPRIDEIMIPELAVKTDTRNS